MKHYRKRRIIIIMVQVLIYGSLSYAQEVQNMFLENAISCVELDIEIEDFEVVEPTIVRVCCGGPFQEDKTPCKIISKASYESFAGQSDEVFEGVNQGIFINLLVQAKKDKLFKVKQIVVNNSSIAVLENNLMITVRKGVYSIDGEGKIYLELEFLN